jgi:hypothetical protein
LACASPIDDCIPGRLSKADEICIKNASIVASSQQQWDAAIGADTASNCQPAVSKIPGDGGHFTLSLTFGAYIGTWPVMAKLHSDGSSSSLDAIHNKEGPFRGLCDERGISAMASPPLHRKSGIPDMASHISVAHHRSENIHSEIQQLQDFICIRSTSIVP